MTTAAASKPWWRSRTLWFNCLVALAATAEASLGLLAPVLGEAAYPMLAFVLALGNAVLRVLTTQPLALHALPGSAPASHPAEGGPP